MFRLVRPPALPCLPLEEFYVLFFSFITPWLRFRFIGTASFTAVLCAWFLDPAWPSVTYRRRETFSSSSTATSSGGHSLFLPLVFPCSWPLDYDHVLLFFLFFSLYRSMFLSAQIVQKTLNKLFFMTPSVLLTGFL